MFTNIGGKIKGFAKIVFGIEVVLSLLLAFGTGFFLAVPIGIFIAWLSVFLLYGYGELIESSQRQVLQNQKILQILSGESVDIHTTDSHELEEDHSFKAMTIPKR